jgi:alpha-glucan,water dikinase
MCYGLCERLNGDAAGFALLVVWLRYSAIRQLDWQRNYNTQPRELSHAEDRLTLKLTESYINTPQVRPFIPLMLMTMGPGGDGQRIRDEILQIMHRHRIKEVSGHFLEEWHQKLHNNATFDDVVICEAYLAFLRTNGDRGRFYEVLNAGGVTEERLRGFERPIRAHPDFVHHLKDALIYDFENYLKTLKSVHSSTDLERALRSSSHLFDDEIKNALHFIGQNKDASGADKVKDLFTAATWVRGRLRQLLSGERDTHKAREMLLLDLSLVEFIRLLAERSQSQDKTALVEFVALAAENLTANGSGSGNLVDEELRVCIGHLRRNLPPQGAPDWVLHVLSAIERLERILGAAVEWYYQTFQEKAELLGGAFKAASWTINLFTEELLRGQPPFVLSMFLRRLNQVLRREYNLGVWQVISPFEAGGEVVAVDTLYEIQDKAFDSSTVVIAGKVTGNEEIPPGVTAVISPDMTDIVSHVAVRARNARILFATCYDSTALKSLKDLSGRYVSLTITPSGDIAFTETERPIAQDMKDSAGERYILKPVRFEFTSFALPMKDFNRLTAGGKSTNLAALRGRVPEWINLPPSVVIPFGAFEKVLGINPEIESKYRRLLSGVTTETLPRLRALIEGLVIPDEFIAGLKGVMSGAGVSYPAGERRRVEECIRQVWASLWNERAYLSRAKNFAGNPHEGVSMAVLIQEIVNADYAFVIHTVNPVTGARDEVFAEVVLGLGETLVGNHPGRALSFTCKKDGGTPNVAAYPSKSLGLYADGLIFRSDSNVEDLSGFAGAGLYDSIIMKAPKGILLDYSTTPLLRDEAFRNGILSKIKEIGVIVETAFGHPQDIEGAYKEGRYYVLQSRPQVGI